MFLTETSKINNNKFMAGKAMSCLFFSSAKTFSSSATFPSHICSSLTHSFSESMMEENIENAESIIMKWELNSSPINEVTSLFQHSRKEAREFLRSVKDLRCAMHFFVSEHSDSEKLVLAQNLMLIAMKRLEQEFYLILSANRNQLDPESVSGRSSDGSSNSEEEDYGAGSEEEYFNIAGEPILERVAMLAMSDLKSIADCMISSGYGKECIKIYELIRKSIVDEGLYLLGVEQYRSSQIQKMKWEALEHMSKNWIKAVKMAVKTLFSREKVLCDHVFSASQIFRGSCFWEVTKEGAANLFRFPELIAKTKRLPERIFPLMDLYEAIMNLWPEIDMIFNSESTSKIKMQALSSLLRLGESVRAVLSDFESAIQKDSSKTPVPGGGIHPLTRKVMTYLSSLADYDRVLSDIVIDSPSLGHTPLPGPCFDDSMSAASVWLAWLILVLLCKLDSKAELYRDVSLSYLFLANNLQFIIDKVCKTHLHVLLGDDWVSNHVNKFKQYTASYETTAWTKVFLSIPDKTFPNITPEAAKECFRKFNTAFEDAYRKQISWIVPDGKLRDELKISVAKKLVPAYTEFYNTYTVMLKEKNLEVSVRFRPDDLGNYLSDLFHGDAVLASSSPSSSHGCIPQQNDSISKMPLT